MRPSRLDCVAADDADPLAPLRAQFDLPPGVIYLDGNSLGALPRTTVARVTATMVDEWGAGLVTSWNTAGWMDMARRIGDKIATLVGAGPDEVVVADSTSVNLFKVLSAAVRISTARGPGRRVIVSERDNFPTDLYIASSVADSNGMTLRLVDAADVAASVDSDTAMVVLTHVNYRTGAMYDLPAITRFAHDAGALMAWDLAHSAGATPVDLTAARADFAVGCGYKYLNGGPGAPAFVWVRPDHHDAVSQPLSGWIGHDAPFEFRSDYEPAPGIGRYQCGTPPVLSLVALDCGVDTVLAAAPFGGVSALRAKSDALSSLFIDLVGPVCTAHGLTVVTPLEARRRGSQVSIAHPADGYAIMQALIARRVIGDFRAPDVLRFGFTPLYTRHVDVFDAIEHLRLVLENDEWRSPAFATRSAIT